LIDVVREYPSPFFSGPFGWVLADAVSLAPLPVRGAQRLFHVNHPALDA
jgi:hypothetical protein